MFLKTLGIDLLSFNNLYQRYLVVNCSCNRSIGRDEEGGGEYRSGVRGDSRNAPPKDHTATGNTVDHLFRIFTAVSIISTSYSNGIVPEIQATVAPPITGKMFKGLLLSYAVVISTFFSVWISGQPLGQFGNQSQGNILQNFIVNEQPLPIGAQLVSCDDQCLNAAATHSGCSAMGMQTYLQPTNVVLERGFADPKKDEFSSHNVITRIVFRSLSVVVATLLAAMLPFFGDMLALLGAFECIPLDFILLMIFYNVTFKPSKKTIIFWGNTFIVFISTVLSLVGALASVRQIVLDAKTYRLSANV
ncbi:hypothetical protein RHSIM_Rhsim09G0144300 [Rhododendron simsii]|uniref:Amino acid transporter transmembrane domain-containing protein n=1 Tax=Rhododendron simsii TaxID=118357 RepID=A0A834GIY1_RHOSS|nr:hypothetical protein RHSIM_Rhsim09G0144300 [Rhododendron simsii]